MHRWRVILCFVCVVAVAAVDLPQARVLADAPPAAGVPRLWVTPLEIDFGPVYLGMTSPQHGVWVRNVGDGVLVLAPMLTAADGGGPFRVVSGFPATLAPGAQVFMTLEFKPLAAGEAATTLVFPTNAGVFTITLRGEGLPAFYVSPLALDFGWVLRGQTSAAQQAVIHNLSPVALSGEFYNPASAPFVMDPASLCSFGEIPASGECALNFSFAPTAFGSATGVYSNTIPTGAYAVQLMGRGGGVVIGSLALQKVTPRSLDFGPVAVGQQRHASAVFTNQCIGCSVPITGWAGGDVEEPFHNTPFCAGSLADGESCSYTYSFVPTEPGVFTATAAITNSLGTVEIALQGTALGPSLTASPLVLDFGPVPVGQTSDVQTVEVRNTGPLNVTFGPQLFPVHSPFEMVSACGSSLAPGEKCVLSYTYTPTDAGRHSETRIKQTSAGDIRVRLYGGVEATLSIPLVQR